MRHARLATAAAAVGILLSGCDGQGPTAVAPTTGPAPLVAAVRCSASTGARTVQCAPESPQAAANLIILGRQGELVQLTSSNVSYVGTTFSFDVTTQNLLPAPQVMATTDGVTPTAEGVRVFFHAPPTATSGTGAITVNSDGQATYTGSNQDYYEYSGAALGADGMLSSNETSSVRNWSLDVPNTVNTFSFLLYVTADVRFPQGWVELNVAADTVLEGTGGALTPTVRSAIGEVVPAATVTWGSSDTGVMTVDASGNVTALAPGTATITATSGARSGTATYAVCPDLAVGEVYTAVMPGAAALCLAGGAAGNAEYTYMPVNLSTSSALSLTLTGSGIVPVTGPPTPNRIPVGAGGLNLSLSGVRSDELHRQMMERDRELAVALRRNPGNLVQRASRTQRAGGARRVITPGVPAVGDLWNLNVASGCSGSLDSRVGRVVSVGTHVVIVADTTNPAGGFTTAQYDSIRLEFDSLAYPVDTTNFGGPTDLDTNQRVVAFYTRAVNELSPPASSVVTMGYFTARDLFSSAPESCPRSNEGEMFYMLVPDPTGAVNSNVRTVSFVRGSTVGTMAHELQHLINASRRTYFESPTNYEVVWLNEGLSHIAEELLFYRTSVGLAPRGNINLSTLTTGPNASRRVAAFNAYANPNFGRFRSWLQRPDTAGAFKTNDVLAVRGATWAFLRYAADRANGTDATLWSNLVSSTNTGTANLQAELGTDPDPWLRDFVTAMYTDDAVSGIGTPYTQPSWDFRSVYGGLGGFPLGIRALGNGVGLTLSYSRGGGTAYARFGVPMGGFAGITALSGGIPPTSPYALAVVRSK